VFYADTRLELPPLVGRGAGQIMAKLAERDWIIEVEVVMAPLDKRFLVYILGRGVPPPNNNTFRWCTRQIKVDPMSAALEALIAEIDGDVLMITGVRQGESAVRDRRIEMSCSKDGAECGQGWYQLALPEAKGIKGRIATLAPLLHWRVCHVWDWLKVYAPMPAFGGWATAILADAYGGDEAEEINARTGCMGCPLASPGPGAGGRGRHAGLVAPGAPSWPEGHLASPARTGHASEEDRPDDDGQVAEGKNKQRMGPLTFEARLWALGEVLAIQRECNAAAERLGRPGIDILNAEEELRIYELIAAETWPTAGMATSPPPTRRWMPSSATDSVQPLLFGGRHDRPPRQRRLPRLPRGEGAAGGLGFDVPAARAGACRGSSRTWRRSCAGCWRAGGGRCSPASGCTRPPCSWKPRPAGAGGCGPRATRGRGG
jgi:DNA sulfur modification protein DndC